MKKIELLAPAGSYDALRAAVNAGADAVYIGGTRFGARAYADNPGEDELIKGIEFCHLRGRKIYLTVNTLFKDDELTGMLEEYLRPYYSAGIDAVIVQDIGAMSFIERHFPGLPIHVSTQTSITMAEGINRLMKCFPSITRVVPARELSIDEISRFRRETSAEIEVFVHGALCYCYSGQCLMSSMIGGRSGNRGRCAQPCRKLYDGRYLLSPKDNCLLDSFPELIEAGVDSFKIEGRMKSPEYTAGVVSVYRKYIDLWYKLGTDGYHRYFEAHRQSFNRDYDVLRDLFNRGGFSHGYLHTHNGQEMMTFDRPNHSGVQVGEVIAVRGREAVIRFSSMVNAQDILEIRNVQDKVFEFTLGQGSDAGETFSCITMKDRKANVGQPVFRTKCNELLNQISEQYISNDSSICVDCEFTAHIGEQSVLTFRHKDYSVTINGSVVQKAQKAPTDSDTVLRQLAKLGDTSLRLENHIINIDDDIFIVMGELNRLRREAAQMLCEKIVRSGRRNSDDLVYEQRTAEKISDTLDEAINSIESAGMALSISVWNSEQLKAAYSYMPDAEFVCNLTSLNIEEVESYITICSSERILLGLPYVSRSLVYDNLIKLIASVRERYPFIRFMVRNQEELALLEKLNCSYRRDHNLYTMNKDTIEQYQGEFTLSQELNSDELKDSFGNRKDAELIIYGYQPVMFSAQCVYKNKYGRCRDVRKYDFITITDELSHEFRCVQLCGFCMNIIYNSAKLNLFAQSEVIKEINPGHVRIDFTFEDDDEIRTVLEDYSSCFNQGGKENNRNGSDKYTNGHFNRGVQ